VIPIGSPPSRLALLRADAPLSLRKRLENDAVFWTVTSDAKEDSPADFTWSFEPECSDQFVSSIFDNVHHESDLTTGDPLFK
jgi:hypothetical protein